MLTRILILAFLCIISFFPSQMDTALSTVTATVLTPEPQKKDYTVYITNTGERYHRGDCRYLSRSKIAIKKSDAIKQGYTPCKVCRP